MNKELGRLIREVAIQRSENEFLKGLVKEMDLMIAVSENKTKMEMYENDQLYMIRDPTVLEYYNMEVPRDLPKRKQLGLLKKQVSVLEKHLDMLKKQRDVLTNNTPVVEYDDIDVLMNENSEPYQPIGYEMDLGEKQYFDYLDQDPLDPTKDYDISDVKNFKL